MYERDDKRGPAFQAKVRRWSWDFGGRLIRTNNGRYRRGPRNVERDQGPPRFGKGESAAVDQMGAVHKKGLPPDGTGRASAVVGSSWRRQHCKLESGFS